MHCLNYRIGILFRENIQKKSYEMRYFFLDDEANLYYVASLARLQKIIRLSSDLKDIKLKLVQMGEKSFSLTKYAILGPRPYHSEAVLPFSNRTCIDVREKQSKEEKGYHLFGLIDEDTPMLLEEILILTSKKKPEAEMKKRKSVFEEEKNKQEARTADFFKKYMQNEEKFKMQQLESNPLIQFQGDMQAKDASGRCVETFMSQGITYTGNFHNGKKHGVGLLVSQALDSVECEFLCDQLVGI